MRRFPKMALVVLALMATPVLADDGNEGGSVWRRSGALLDRSPQDRDNIISVFVGLPYRGYAVGPGVGGRFYLSLVKDGFISAINDEFALEFGADFSFLFGYTGFRGAAIFSPVLGLPVEAVWNFHLTNKFALYAKAGLVFEMGFANYYGYLGYGTGFGVAVWPIGGVGLMFKVSDKIVLRAEAGYPWLKIGIGFGL